MDWPILRNYEVFLIAIIFITIQLRINATSRTSWPDATKVQRWLSACPQEEEADEEEEGDSARGC